MIFFKTYEEQIKILLDRGLVISDISAAKSFLEANNYYNVINAYKDIFIKQGINPEQFKPNVSFDDIKNLWLFDKELSAEIPRFTTLIERTLKSKIAYVISRNYGTIDYLDIQLFNPIYTIDASKLISEINLLIDEKLKYNDPMISHYKQKYNCIPLWVLINALSFSQTIKLYKFINESTKTEIACEFGRLNGKRIENNDLSRYAKIINLFRNLSAHDQRIFDFKPYNCTAKGHPINTHCGTKTISVGLFAFVGCVYSLSSTEVFRELLLKLHNAWLRIEKNLSLEYIDLVYKKTGFPKNWRDLLNLQ